MKKLIYVLGVSIFSLSTPAHAAVIQNSQVFDSNSGAPIEGASATLNRMQDSVFLDLETTLEPGDAYTVWWVIFNNPEFCVDECDGPDLSIPEVNGSSFYATGDIVPTNQVGNFSFSAQLNEGELPTGFDQVLRGNGLDDALGAEIHPVIRTHGAVIPGMETEQITEFNGGCRPGDPNEGQCENVQFAVFPAASTPESSSGLGLLAFGAVGIASVLQRRVK